MHLLFTTVAAIAVKGEKSQPEKCTRTHCVSVYKCLLNATFYNLHCTDDDERMIEIYMTQTFHIIVVNCGGLKM